MKRNTVIGIGIVGVSILAYVIYKNKQKQKAEADQRQRMSDAERAKAKAEADALAAKTETEQRKVYSDGAMKLADLIQAGSKQADIFNATGEAEILYREAQQLKLTDAQIAIQAEQKKRISDKLRNTVSSGILSTDELKKIYDSYLTTQNKYVGTASYGQVNDAAHAVFIKYHIVEEYKQPMQPVQTFANVYSLTR